MTTNKILSVSVIEGEYHYLEVERKGGGIFAGQAQVTTSLEALLSTCRKVDQVHVNASFPSTTYQITTLPKVARKYLAGLVKQDAGEKMAISGEIVAQHGTPEEVVDSGVDKWRLPYVAVAEEEVRALWDSLAGAHRRIKHLSPLPVAAAAMVVALNKPEKDFLLVWVGLNTTLILIASPTGVVYMARTVPLGLVRRRLHLDPAPVVSAAPSAKVAQAAPAPAAEQAPVMVGEEQVDGLVMELGEETAIQEEPVLDLGLAEEAPAATELSPDAQLAADFIWKLEREINMTITFFKQEFRQAAPNTAFILGNRNLQAIIAGSTVIQAFPAINFRLNTAELRGLSEEAAAENLALLGNLFLGDAFNFIPSQEVVKRRAALGLNIAVGALIVSVGATALWANQQMLTKEDLLKTQQIRVTELQGIENQKATVNQEINRLKPLLGWKTFHESIFVQQPAWDMFVSEMALLLDDRIALASFDILPGSGASRDCKIEGSIRAQNWDEGLKHFREFGKRLHASPIFEVQTLTYAPEGVQASPRTYGFQINLRLTDKGKGNEA